MGVNNRSVTLLKSGNRLVLSPTTAEIAEAVSPVLSFTETKQLRGKDAVEAGADIEFIDWQCFTFDHRDRLSTSFGFYSRVTKALKQAHFKVKLEDLTPPQRPEIFEPRWERLVGPESPYGLRHKQLDFLVKLLSRPCGCFDCPPGYGKSFLIGLIATLLPKAKIHVVTKRVPVLRDRIYPELCQMVPNVGIVGGGKKIYGRRVMLFSADSLHNSDGDADILIGDECHELAADRAAYNLGRYDRSRNYGLSASHNMRLDNKDLRVEGIFGPIIFKVSYQEAVQHGMVVPIRVIWRKVNMDMNPCSGLHDVAKKRRGIWRNTFRNEMIAEDANRYDDDTQTLITVETIDHAVHLKKLLPNFTLVYAEEGMDPEVRDKYIRWGLISRNEPHMDRARRDKLTKMFEKGKLKKAICTPVWNVGVSFNNLAVLIRGDAGGSPINDVQIPGRVSRITQSGDKPYGIIHDYQDKFDNGFKIKSGKRKKSYADQGWEQDWPSRSRSKAKQANPSLFEQDDDDDD